MNKRLLMVLTASILAILLCACGFRETSYSQIKIREAPRKVRAFLLRVDNENGVYSYSDGRTLYVFLNVSNEMRGEYIPYFENLRASMEDGVLSVYYDERITQDDIDNAPKYNIRALYRIRTPQIPEYLRIYKNGEETFFGSHTQG